MHHDKVLDFLQRQSTPVTARQLAKFAGGKVAAIEAALTDLAAEGKAFALTQGKDTAYAVRRPDELCAEALASVLASQTSAQAPAKLKGMLHKALRPWFDEALGRLIVQGKANWLPSGKKQLVLNRRVRPSDVITKAQLTAVQKLLTEANRRRAKALTVEQFLSWLDGDTTPAPAVSAHASRAQLVAWYHEDRAHSSSTMVPIPLTWQRYAAWADSLGEQPDASTFRAALSEMYDAGQAILEPCERPQDLSDRDRSLQVPLTFGPPGYYWKPLE